MSEQRKDYRALVLRFVEVYVELNGYPPTYQEIMESVGLGSKSHVDYYLDALEADKLIVRKPRSPRSVRPHGHPAQHLRRCRRGHRHGGPQRGMDRRAGTDHRRDGLHGRSPARPLRAPGAGGLDARRAGRPRRHPDHRAPAVGAVRRSRGRVRGKPGKGQAREAEGRRQRGAIHSERSLACSPS